MDKDKLEIKYKDIDSLEEWEENPQQHDMAALNRSVDKFGPRQPIIVRKENNRIIAGHGRLKAYRNKGMQKVPVLEWDCTEEEANSYAIADNQTTMALGWDEEELSDIMQEIDEYEGEMSDAIDCLGFSTKELDRLLDNEEEPEEPFERDIWELELTIEDKEVYNQIKNYLNRYYPEIEYETI